MGNKVLIKEDFVREYARRSNITLNQLGDFGLKAYPCDCGEVGCQGWQMLHEPPLKTGRNNV